MIKIKANPFPFNVACIYFIFFLMSFLISLDRFTAEMEMDLKGPLTALGITDIFIKGKADFRHLSE